MLRYFWQLLADPRMGFSPSAAFFFLFFLRKTHHQKQEKPPGAGTPPLHLPLHSFGVAGEMSPLSPPVPRDAAPVQPPTVLGWGSTATPTAAGSSGQVLLAGVTPAGCHHCHHHTQTVPNAPVSPPRDNLHMQRRPQPWGSIRPSGPQPRSRGCWHCRVMVAYWGLVMSRRGQPSDRRGLRCIYPGERLLGETKHQVSIIIPYFHLLFLISIYYSLLPCIILHFHLLFLIAINYS